MSKNEWLTDKELQALVKEPESEYLERCESNRNTDKIGEAICAFSNNLSGREKPSVIFIGLKDNGEFSELSITDEMLRNIANIRSDGNLQPFPVINIKKLIIQKKELISIEVLPISNSIMRYKARCFVRIGPSVRQASEEEEQILVEKRVSGLLSFDMTGIKEAKKDEDLNNDYFKNEYLPVAVSKEVLLKNDRNPDKQMRSLGLLDSDLNPTVTAILIIGKNPRLWIPGAFIQFIRFDGTKLTDPIKDQQEVSFALPEQIRRIEEILKINISTSLKLSPGGPNIQSSDYPFTALSQIVRNAIIHRDYGSHTPIRVHWFNDRIEIQSPGGPYGQVNAQNFGTEGLTSYRNPTIATALKNLGFIERFGFGIPQAKKALKENGNPELEWDIKNSTILTVIKKKA